MSATTTERGAALARMLDEMLVVFATAVPADRREPPIVTLGRADITALINHDPLRMSYGPPGMRWQTVAGEVVLKPGRF